LGTLELKGKHIFKEKFNILNKERKRLIGVLRAERKIK